MNTGEVDKTYLGIFIKILVYALDKLVNNHLQISFMSYARNQVTSPAILFAKIVCLAIGVFFGAVCTHKIDVNTKNDMYAIFVN